MSLQSFQLPSKQAVQQFMQIQQFKKQPLPIGAFAKQFIVAGVWMSALCASFFMVVNPLGSAARINYEKKIPAYWRHTRKFVPFVILLGGMVTFDKARGII